MSSQTTEISEPISDFIEIPDSDGDTSSCSCSDCSSSDCSCRCDSSSDSSNSSDNYQEREAGDSHQGVGKTTIIELQEILQEMKASKMIGGGDISPPEEKDDANQMLIADCKKQGNQLNKLLALQKSKSELSQELKKVSEEIKKVLKEVKNF
jgi:hypothetical protein